MGEVRSKRKRASRLATLARGLEKRGYQIVHIDTITVVVRTAEDVEYVLSAADDSHESWVSASQMLFEASLIEESPFATDVLRFAMQLHSRYLGCRFGLDDEGCLAVQYDIYPDMSVTHVAGALQQLAYVGLAAWPLFREVLARGAAVVDEARIDSAFGLDDAGAN